MNEKIGGGDIASVEQAEIIPSTVLVNESGGSVVECYAFTCLGDNIFGIFENKDEIIIESSIVWVKTNKTIWEGRVIKIPYRNLPHDSNDEKLI